MSFAERFAHDQRLMYRIVDYVGWESGATLGTKDCEKILFSGRPWFYDRTAGLVFVVTHAHPVCAAVFYSAYKKVPHDLENADKFVEEGMGWWLSSISLVSRKIMVGKDVRLNAQEKFVFDGFQIDRI